MLVVFSGLPGVGKTTIALARATGAVYLRVDSIEDVLRREGWKVEGEGYGVAHAVARDNLRLGRVVVADCVNPWPLTRNEWRAVARCAGVRVLDVEVVCSDVDEHRCRVETRVSDLRGFVLPTWSEVVEHDYRPRGDDRLVIDSARSTLEESVEAIVTAMRA